MSEKTLIAVGTDANDEVWPAHFGVSPYYNIYDSEGRLLEKRLNPYGPAGDQDKHHGNPMLIVDLLPECRVFIGRAMGNKQRLAKQLGITPIATDESDPEVAVQAFLRDGR